MKNNRTSLAPQRFIFQKGPEQGRGWQIHKGGPGPPLGMSGPGQRVFGQDSRTRVQCGGAGRKEERPCGPVPWPMVWKQKGRQVLMPWRPFTIWLGLCSCPCRFPRYHNTTGECPVVSCLFKMAHFFLCIFPVPALAQTLVLTSAPVHWIG